LIKALLTMQLKVINFSRLSGLSKQKNLIKEFAATELDLMSAIECLNFLGMYIKKHTAKGSKAMYEFNSSVARENIRKIYNRFKVCLFQVFFFCFRYTPATFHTVQRKTVKILTRTRRGCSRAALR
jgi:hypothetical protein